MATVFFKGEPIPTIGRVPEVGKMAPAFTLTDKSLKDKTLNDFLGKTLVLNIFPSIDTGTCAASVHAFNRAASSLEQTLVLCISMDLPFAQARFCGAEDLNDVITLSAFRHPEFGQAYGVTITAGPMKGLLSRAVVVINPEGRIIYTEHVAEITQEPDYATALGSIQAG
ncbi:MAG: thiol peroxidase [Gammaproteobacteria bacterium]